MKPSRMLRVRAQARKSPTPKAAVEADDKPTTYFATSGSSVAERVSRRFEHGEHSWSHDMPIVMGFRPNEERA